MNRTRSVMILQTEDGNFTSRVMPLTLPFQVKSSARGEEIALHASVRQVVKLIYKVPVHTYTHARARAPYSACVCRQGLDKKQDVLCYKH